MEHIATSKNFKTLARMGYGARGVVYLMIGGLALLTAFGEGGKTTDSRGAITEIMQQPFGEILLTIRFDRARHCVVYRRLVFGSLCIARGQWRHKRHCRGAGYFA